MINNRLWMCCDPFPPCRCHKSKVFQWKLPGVVVVAGPVQDQNHAVVSAAHTQINALITGFMGVMLRQNTCGM